MELYSKRQKKLRGDFPDVYIYDDLPENLRVQIVHIIRHVLGFQTNRETNNAGVRTLATLIINTLRKEYGVFSLLHHRTQSSSYTSSELISFFLAEEETERCMDVIELCFRAIDRYTRRWDYYQESDYDERADDALAELNARFKEHGVGYQFEDGSIVRIDSELIHTEAVKPALRLLNTNEYQGAHDEFINAYDHYRHGNNKEALNECLKAFESTMKAICVKRGWAYDPGDTAKKLIEICLKQGLVPTFWQTQLSSLRSLLESGIPTGRNKLSGHGQGATPSAVPNEIAAYMLHMTASTLVFLTTAEKNLP